MSSVTIHSTIGSPPCRAVLLTAKALGIQPKVKEVDIMGGATRTPEFQKLNPQHSIPVLEDKGLVLAESRAILEYLCDAYGKTDSLYPRDIKLRALINARLYFDASTLYSRFMVAYLGPLIKGFEQTQSSLDLLKDALSTLDLYIGDQDYLVAKKLTIADIAIAVTVSNIEAFKFDLTPYNNLTRWLENMKKVIPGYYEINQKGCDLLGAFWAQKNKSSKMPIDFYYVPGSAPCRSVLLAAKSLGLDLNLKLTDLMKNEHLTPEFIKMNPQHTVPTLNDNGFCLWESRAILAYLVEQYGKDDSLYPKDAKKRAIVNQRLYFDATTLYQRFGDLYYPMMFGGASFDDSKKEKLEEALGFLNSFLDGNKWVAGPNITIADFAVVSSVSTIDAVGFSLSAYPNVEAWYKRAQKELPGYEVNGDGAEQFGQWFKSTQKK